MSVEPDIFFSVSPAAQAWHTAMQQQTDHESVCAPCQINRVPNCDEGERLQEAALDAHAAWASDQYAGRAVS